MLYVFFVILRRNMSLHKIFDCKNKLYFILIQGAGNNNLQTFLFWMPTSQKTAVGNLMVKSTVALSLSYLSMLWSMVCLCRYVASRSKIKTQRVMDQINTFLVQSRHWQQPSELLQQQQQQRLKKLLNIAICNN